MGWRWLWGWDGGRLWWWSRWWRAAVGPWGRHPRQRHPPLTPPPFTPSLPASKDSAWFWERTAAADSLRSFIPRATPWTGPRRLDLWGAVQTGQKLTYTLRGQYLPSGTDFQGHFVFFTFVRAIFITALLNIPVLYCQIPKNSVLTLKLFQTCPIFFLLLLKMAVKNSKMLC